jgi:chorismate mutase
MTMTLDEALAALEEYRQIIDELDLRILELLNERSKIACRIGEVKEQVHLPIYEPKREDQVYRNVTENNPGPLGPDAVKRVFERIIDEMRSIQRDQMLERRARDEARQPASPISGSDGAGRESV